MSQSLLNKQVAFAILKWMKKQEQNSSLESVTQLLGKRFHISLDDPECKDACDVGLDLDDAARSLATKNADTVALQERKLKEFIVILKQRGYFHGVEEGTPAYFERYETAKQKFMARNNPYDGLTADQLKTHGNQKMVNGNHQEAVGYYSKAIEMDGSSAIYYANRAAAYTHLKDYKKAVVDCEAALKIDPTYSKAFSRLGTALFYNGEYALAVEKYAKAVELDPSNQAFQADLVAAQEKMQEIEANAQPLANMPFDFSNMANMLNNPEFMAMAQNVMQQPQFAEMVNKVAGNLGANLTSEGLPDLSQLFAGMAAQQPADGSMPEEITTPFGTIRRQQLESLQQMPEIRDNPKFHAIMADVQAQGPMAMLRHMDDPEVLSTMTKVATSLLGGAN